MKTSAASLLTSVVLGTSTVLGAAVAPIKTRDSKITPITVKGNGAFLLYAYICDVSSRQIGLTYHLSL